LRGSEAAISEDYSLTSKKENNHLIFMQGEMAVQVRAWALLFIAIAIAQPFTSLAQGEPPSI
jgi:hypothetical protein